MIQKFFLHCVILVLLTGVPVFMLIAFENPIAAGNLYDLLVAILNSIIYIVFPVVVMMIIYTGFLFVSAQGNPAKLEEARRALLWTIIGAIIILGSKALALAIQATVRNIQG